MFQSLVFGTLAPGTGNKPCDSYEVIKPMDTMSGKVASWFDQPSGGMQFKLLDTIKNLLDNDFIKKI